LQNAIANHKQSTSGRQKILYISSLRYRAALLIKLKPSLKLNVNALFLTPVWEFHPEH